MATKNILPSLSFLNSQPAKHSKHCNTKKSNQEKLSRDMSKKEKDPKSRLQQNQPIKRQH